MLSHNGKHHMIGFYHNQRLFLFFFIFLFAHGHGSWVRLLLLGLALGVSLDMFWARIKTYTNYIYNIFNNGESMHFNEENWLKSRNSKTVFLKNHILLGF